MYSVLFIYFDDDYKKTEDRYDVNIFPNLLEAELFVNKTLVDCLEQYFNDNNICNTHCESNKNEIHIKEQFRNNRLVLEMLVKECLSGKYINCKIDYQLREHSGKY